MARLGAKIRPGRGDGARPRLAIVAVAGVVERVGEHASAVEPLPPEEIVGKAVGLRPVDLDGEKRVDAALAHELRQRRRKAEAVGQPADPMALAERPLEIALAVEDLPRQALAARHVRIGLDPHAADRLPLARRDALANLGEQFWIVLLDLRVELRARLVEAELGRALHQRQHGREGAPQFAPRLLIGPQPGEVDVGMAGESDLALRREAPLQATQRRGKSVGGRLDAGAFALAQRRRIGDRLGPAPDRLLLGRGRDTGDIIRRRRRPVDRPQRRFRGFDEVRRGLMLAERLGRLDDETQQLRKSADGGIEAKQRRALQARDRARARRTAAGRRSRRESRTGAHEAGIPGDRGRGRTRPSRRSRRSRSAGFRRRGRAPGASLRAASPRESRRSPRAAPTRRAAARALEARSAAPRSASRGYPASRARARTRVREGASCRRARRWSNRSGMASAPSDSRRCSGEGRVRHREIVREGNCDIGARPHRIV